MFSLGVAGLVQPPGSPLYWYQGKDVNFPLMNAGLANASAVATWKNKGSARTNAAQASTGAKPAFQQCAVAGKIRNNPSVRAVDQARTMTSTAAGASMAQPWTLAMVYLWNGASINCMMGNGSVPRLKIYLNNAGGALTVEMTAVNFNLSAAATPLPASNLFHYMIATCANGGTSVLRSDGVTSTSGNPGAGDFGTQIILFANAVGQNMAGDIAELLLYDNTAPPSFAALEAYITHQHGATWPN